MGLQIVPSLASWQTIEGPSPSLIVDPSQTLKSEDTFDLSIKHSEQNTVLRPLNPFLLTTTLATTGCVSTGSEAGDALLMGLGGAAWALSSLTAGAHILATQNGRQSPFGWLASSFFIPILGPALWFVFGAEPHLPTSSNPKHTFLNNRYAERRQDPPIPDEIPDFVPESFRPMLRLSRTIAREPLVGGNHVTPLFNGEETYPSMLEAIESESKGGFVYVGMYIFENNEMGEKFAAALKRAQDRGVEVRVIVDRLGNFVAMPHDIKKIWRLLCERGQLPTSTELLDRHGVHYKRFAPGASLRNGLPWNIIYHKKFLVTSRKAYLGSINIGDTYMVTRTDIDGRHQDIQYLIEGPAAPLIEAVHREDWAYLTGAPVEQNRANDTRVGEDFVRVVRSMPNDDFENFKKIVLAAIGLAAPGEKVRLQTAYFAPDREFIRTLELACQRGVIVQFILSKENTVPPVDWASRQFFPDLLDAGVELYYQPPPFDHTKLMTVGDYYTLGSSANFDHRSQTFHNEAGIEIYSKRVNAIVSARFDLITADPQNRITREWIKSWPWHERMRNAISQLPSYVY